MIDVAMPAQPQASSSVISAASSAHRPTPPSSLGMHVLEGRGQARSMICAGNFRSGRTERDRRDLFTRESARRLLQGELLVAQAKVHENSRSTRCRQAVFIIKSKACGAS